MDIAITPHTLMHMLKAVYIDDDPIESLDDLLCPYQLHEQQVRGLFVEFHWPSKRKEASPYYYDVVLAANYQSKIDSSAKRKTQSEKVYFTHMSTSFTHVWKNVDDTFVYKSLCTYQSSGNAVSYAWFTIDPIYQEVILQSHEGPLPLLHLHVLRHSRMGPMAPLDLTLFEDSKLNQHDVTINLAKMTITLTKDVSVPNYMLFFTQGHNTLQCALICPSMAVSYVCPLITHRLE